MKTIEYRWEKREFCGKPWPSGPWDDEPDKVQFEEQGLPALVVRNHFGAWCGYVGVHEGHPWFGKDYTDIDDVSVHGGLTFSEFCSPVGGEEYSICHVPEPGESDRVWWLGFDCAHGGDVMPVFSDEFHSWGEYRDLAYVRAHVAALAQQALEAGVNDE